MIKRIASFLLFFLCLFCSFIHVSFSAPAKQADKHQASFSSAPRVVIHMRHVSMPRPKPIQHASHIVNDQRHVARPLVDGTGAKISEHELRTPPQHETIAHNHSMINQITEQQKTETLQNHYYWHEMNGMKYAHYRDEQGTDWYGFYHQNSFYWTRYFAERWWWYDNNYARWVFWSEGFWWWSSPDNILYVYADNNYYPYDETVQGVTVMQPVVEQPPTSFPAADQGKTFTSPDGQRLVEISGVDNQAFLFDTSSGQASFIKYLGEFAASVQYSQVAAQKPLQILIHFTDGSFALFDANGSSLEPPQPPLGSDALVDAPLSVPSSPID